MDFDLRAHTLLLTVTGSRAYGIHRPDSDLDVKGVAVPPTRYFHGFAHKFEQADKPGHLAVFASLLPPEESAIVATSKLEGSVYEIRKFLGLAAACNPNILDVLFCRDDEVRLATPAGTRLRQNRRLFLSATAKRTYTGYAAAQLKRIKGHRKWLLDPPTHFPTRAEFGLPEHTLLPADQIAAVNAAVAKEIEGDPQGADDATWLAAARTFGLDDNLIYVMVQERGYA
nr:nucleotidyltransferase domain-containing protein [Deltaproteobacteria bacterium]